METKAKIYIPAVFRSFQGFEVKDIKEFQSKHVMEIILEPQKGKEHICSVCDSKLGAQDGGYWVKARHMRMMNWHVYISFRREKRYCLKCKKIRSEKIDFISESSPHVTKDLAWWVGRLTEITTVLSVSRLEDLDKQTCYRIDKDNLTKILQTYKIPPVSRISVDEVYARGPKQKKEGETRDDLFLTVIVDIQTHKVIWVSQSRRKEALDEFFLIIGKEACSKIEVVAADQHEAYGASVREHCANATLVWDRFHLVQNFNVALNEDRKEELKNVDPEGAMGDLMNGKYRFLFTSRPYKRTEQDKKHIDEVMKLNEKMAKMELIKEKFHSFFTAKSLEEAQVIMAEAYQWAFDAKANHIFKWLRQIREEQTFWNYLLYKVTTGVSEGMNRVIKGLKWQAFGYKDMGYFKLKILQKAGYLNSRYNPLTV